LTGGGGFAIVLAMAQRSPAAAAEEAKRLNSECSLSQQQHGGSGPDLSRSGPLFLVWS